MKYIIGFLITVGLIILLIVLLVTGGGGSTKTKVPNTSKALVSYADDPSAKVRLTIDGPINAPQDHRASRITVSRDNATYEKLVGYDGQVLTSQTFANTQTSYTSFLRAIELAGFTNGDTSEALKNDRGHCPLGTRYIFEFEQNGKQLERFWTSSCSGMRSFNGKTALNLALFKRQIPGFSKLDGQDTFGLNLQ